MTNVYANPRWIRERPTAMFDAATLLVDWIGGPANRMCPPRRAEGDGDGAASGHAAPNHARPCEQRLAA